MLPFSGSIITGSWAIAALILIVLQCVQESQTDRLHHHNRQRQRKHKKDEHRISPARDADIELGISKDIPDCTVPKIDPQDWPKRWDGTLEGRISGGQSTAWMQFPPSVYIDVVEKDGNLSKCSGTIVDSDIVLTAGHCVEPGTKMAIVYTGDLNPGTLDFVRHTRPKLIRTAQLFASGKAEGAKIPSYNDWGLIRTDKPFRFHDDREDNSTLVTRACIWLDPVSELMPLWVHGRGSTEGDKPHKEWERQGTSLLHAPGRAKVMKMWRRDCTLGATGICLEPADQIGYGAICPGDSGSGILYMEPKTLRLHVAGVNSEAIVYIDGNKTLRCLVHDEGDVVTFGPLLSDAVDKQNFKESLKNLRSMEIPTKPPGQKRKVFRDRFGRKHLY